MDILIGGFADVAWPVHNSISKRIPNGIRGRGASFLFSYDKIEEKFSLYRHRSRFSEINMEHDNVLGFGTFDDFQLYRNGQIEWFKESVFEVGTYEKGQPLSPLDENVVAEAIEVYLVK